MAGLQPLNVSSCFLAALISRCLRCPLHNVTLAQQPRSRTRPPCNYCLSQEQEPAAECRNGTEPLQFCHATSANLSPCYVAPRALREAPPLSLFWNVWK